MAEESAPSSEVSREALFEQLWQSKDIVGARLVTLPNTESSYGFPVQMGLRTVRSQATGETQGYIIGLFENREDIRPQRTLSETREESLGIARYKLRALTGKEPSEFSVAPVEPIGWLILEPKENKLDGLVCHTSQIVEGGKGIVRTNLINDPYFINLARLNDINALSVGFNQAFTHRRVEALHKLPSEIASQFEPNDQLRSEHLLNRIHFRRGLGTLLLEMGSHLTKKLNYKKIYFQATSPEANDLLKSYKDKHSQTLRTENDWQIIV